MKMRNETSRACDRCHALKERCQWPQGPRECIRCCRLGFECESLRPLKKAGRPPRAELQRRAILTSRACGDARNERGVGSLDMRNFSSVLRPSVARSLSEFSDLSGEDQHLIQQVMFDDDAMNTFVLGPSFWEVHRGHLISHFLVSKHSLKDAYLALAHCWTGAADSPGEDKAKTDAYHLHASSALMRLRQFQVHNSHGVSECLLLAGLIVSFANRSSVSDVSTVCNQALSLVKPSYESGSDFGPEELVFLTCLIIPELIHCLLHGTIPTLRFRPALASKPTVDRYLGLCAPLLPYFYDLCELGNALSYADEDDVCQVLEALDPVESAVLSWQPQMPVGFCSDFTTLEVTHILCQAQVMRLAALLIIHRLRFPFGTNDKPAQIMAACILTQLEMTYSATKKAVVSVILPVLAAYLNIDDEAERDKWYLRIPDIIGYSPPLAAYYQSLISSFWTTRDVLESIAWYNIGDVLSPLV
ncbi:hypothetical protein G7Z17_g2251 [Cylindrodendrum hubeiense]|uniref:Zn(2)-C6 fungal-type domain-containing protein n=1 Tax=Cylindrodendrum hubeiense TaxID=595255 RepID=A0A9P5LKL2_9HYPO|nr:hypothetical protein G7Z17_g2251 [Cylindrodendrum hubeiense]